MEKADAFLYNFILLIALNFLQDILVIEICNILPVLTAVVVSLVLTSTGCNRSTLGADMGIGSLVWMPNSTAWFASSPITTGSSADSPTCTR